MKSEREKKSMETMQRNGELKQEERGKEKQESKRRD